MKLAYSSLSGALSRLVLLACVTFALLPALPVHAQVFPLSENSWRNPEFVKRFLGSYGVNTRVEPEITREESLLFQTLVPLFTDDPQGAIQLLRQSIKPETSAALEYTLASLLLQDGQHEEAILLYRTAIRKFPNFLRAYKNLGLAHLQLGQFDEAIPMIVKAIELGDGDGNTYGLLGYAYLNTGRMQSALDAYRIANLLRPENRDWRVGKAHSLAQVGNFREAAATLQELLLETPGQRSLWLARVNAFIGMGEEQQAAAQLELLKRLGLADPASRRLLADIYMNDQLPALALPNYIAAIEGADRLALPVALPIATTLTRFGAYREAALFINALRQSYARELTQENRSELLNLEAEIALATGEETEAAEILAEVVKVDPVNGRALILLGDYHSRMGEHELAAFYFERAQHLPAFRADALVQHARMAVAQRDYQKAVTLLTEAQRVQPRANVEAYLDAVRNALDATR